MQGKIENAYIVDVVTMKEALWNKHVEPQILRLWLETRGFHKEDKQPDRLMITEWGWKFLWADLFVMILDIKEKTNIYFK